MPAASLLTAHAQRSHSRGRVRTCLNRVSPTHPPPPRRRISTYGCPSRPSLRAIRSSAVSTGRLSRSGRRRLAAADRDARAAAAVARREEVEEGWPRRPRLCLLLFLLTVGSCLSFARRSYLTSRPRTVQKCSPFSASPPHRPRAAHSATARRATARCMPPRSRRTTRGPCATPRARASMPFMHRTAAHSASCLAGRMRTCGAARGRPRPSTSPRRPP